MKPGEAKVSARHALRKITNDSRYEIEFARDLRASHTPDELIVLYARYASSAGAHDTQMRRIVFRAIVRKMGNGIIIEPNVGFKHAETFEIGDGVFIGSSAFIQGRANGRCVIGSRSWIGPQSYLDARNLVIGKSVGWGPGAKVLGSAHTGIPIDVPVINTDLVIKPVRIGDWSDIGTNATILPGVTIGKGAMVGAGAVVVKNVPANAVAAGVPAETLYMRNKK